MKKNRTLFFGTSYITDAEAWRQRYSRWLKHHQQIFGEECVYCLIDDASPYTQEKMSLPVLSSLESLSPATKGPFIFRFDKRLGRKAGVWEYHGWWRSFLAAESIAKALSCNRIIHVESDAFLLTKKICKAMLSVNEGWIAAWCESQNFPESAIQVICEDQFGPMRLLSQRDPTTFGEAPAELLLPFTAIMKNFVGDRYSEFRDTIPKNADFAVQVLPGQKTWFR